MNATTAAIDLAKNVFQVALADANARVLEQHRLTRAQFERFFDNRNVARVVMEACGSAHHWARVFTARGIEVMLLPAHYVSAYVRRSKTDAADALALLEAARCADIVAVKVKSVEQQSLQAVHRTRSLWMGTRTSRINALRGFCRELGLHVPVGARTGLEAMARRGRRSIAHPRIAASDHAAIARGDPRARGPYRAAGASARATGA
jgi:transposase